MFDLDAFLEQEFAQYGMSSILNSLLLLEWQVWFRVSRTSLRPSCAMTLTTAFVGFLLMAPEVNTHSYTSCSLLCLLTGQPAAPSRLLSLANVALTLQGLDSEPCATQGQSRKRGDNGMSASIRNRPHSESMFVPLPHAYEYYNSLTHLYTSPPQRMVTRSGRAPALKRRTMIEGRTGRGRPGMFRFGCFSIRTPPPHLF